MPSEGPLHPHGGRSPGSRHETTSALRYRLLGALEAIRDGKPCTPNAPLQRVLLTLLLLHRNELLSSDRLIDELWEVHPPRSAAAALQMYISSLRRILAPDEQVARGGHHSVLRTQNRGYLIRVLPGQLDLDTFRALATHGRSCLAEGRCAEASELFRRALSLWRGPALADLTRSSQLTRYAVRLESEHFTLLRERIGVDLCQGRSNEVIGELEALCAEHPLQESLHRQLMLAHYLSGGRAEALSVYSRAHRTMVDEAGIEPGPDLRDVQHAILTGLPVPDPHRGRCVSAGLSSRQVSWRR